MDNTDCKYTANAHSKPSRPGCWDVLTVDVLENGKKIGEYKRNYHTLYGTFVPFCRDGQWYALYSKDYTATRIMSLPDCKDVSGQDADGLGFCPVEFYVPRFHFVEFTTDTDTHSIMVWEHEYDKDDPAPDDAEWEYANFGLIAGCVWGDDCSWKIQYIDITDPTNPKQDERLGYIELPNDMSLKESVQYISDSQKYISLSVTKTFGLDHENPS